LAVYLLNVVKHDLPASLHTAEMSQVFLLRAAGMQFYLNEVPKGAFRR
jgi:hypothetical protein